jgi:hypothetical protein
MYVLLIRLFPLLPVVAVTTLLAAIIDGRVAMLAAKRIAQMALCYTSIN